MDSCATYLFFLQGHQVQKWERKQLRPYPDGPGKVWKGEILGQQCFYGFQDLDTVQGSHQATFGGWLPDHAITAVREWLDTVHIKQSAQASRFPRIVSFVTHCPRIV